ncbi:MAG TPA: hypothetical protein ENN63_05235 [Bacteroidetes bacterium]|nr:hypothetical protein [Bacteroidota bacterium]
MKPFSKKHWILFVLGSSLWFQAGAQDTERVIALADSLFRRERYDHAIKEYQRALFFDPGYRRAYVTGLLGHTWFLRQDYTRAARYYDIALNLQENDSLRMELHFRKVLCQMLGEEYQFALIELFGMPGDMPHYFERRRDFYLGACYYSLGSLEEAALAWEEALQDAPEEKLEALNHLLRGKNKYNRPNPNTAWYLSLILPGTGQFYAGDIRNGINSLVLNAGIVYLAYTTAVNYSVIDAVVSILPWLQRYWQGGFMKASDIARKKREKNREELLLQIYDLFEKEAK